MHLPAAAMELEKRDFWAMMYLHYRQGKLASDSHQILLDAFTDQAPAKRTVYWWFGEFKRGKSNLKDDPRPGRPLTAVTEENVDAVERLIDQEPRITYQSIEEILGIGSAAIKTILKDRLGVSKRCARWVPHRLTNDQKRARVVWCQLMLRKFDQGHSKLVWEILTGDETWIYQYDPETKVQSSIWIFPMDEPPVKFRRSRSTGKVMVASFFRRGGHVATVELQDRRTVNADWYISVCLPEVFQEIENRWPNTGLHGLLLHHDNASAHTAAVTLDFLAERGVQLVTHPPYSPDLAPCDFFLFPKMKERLRGKQFQTPEEAVLAYRGEIETLSDMDWGLCFAAWFRRMKSCIECQGDYFEKL